MTRTVKQKVAATKISRNKSKPTRVHSGLWNFRKAAEECTAAGFSVHSDAEEHWEQQKTYHSGRKMLMKDGIEVALQSILDGAIKAIKLTKEEKAFINAKISDTQIKNDNRQQHWMEVAAFNEAFRMLNSNGDFEYETVPDNLGPDFLVRRKGTQLYCAIQVKSAKVHDGADTSYHISKKDGNIKYKHLVILAIGIDPQCTKPENVLFDDVADVKVKELFLYNRAGDMPNKTLEPYPRQNANDKYGDTRCVVGFDNEERLDTMRENFETYITLNSKWTKQDAWFGCDLTYGLEKRMHYAEVLNCKKLAELIGLDNLRAPKAQGECVDVVAVVNGVDVRISLKTATMANGSHFFNKRAAPNAQFCDLILAFYYDKATQVRTHISVIPSEKVYGTKTKNFCWGVTKHKDIIKTRIDTACSNATEVLLQAKVEAIE
jgi:hypothetical protein